MRIARRAVTVLARRDWEEEAWECAVRRCPSCVQLPGLAFGEAYLVVAAGDTQAGRAVADSLEEVAGIDQAAVGLVAGIDHVDLVAAVGCGAAADRMHLLKR